VFRRDRSGRTGRDVSWWRGSLALAAVSWGDAANETRPVVTPDPRVAWGEEPGHGSQVLPRVTSGAS